MHTLKTHHFIHLAIALFFSQLSSTYSLAAIGGQPTSEGVHASIVNIVFDKTVCSGIVIAPNVILTGAHCAKNDSKPILVAHIKGGQKTKPCNISNVVDSEFEPSAEITPFGVHNPDLYLLKIENPLCDAKPAILQTDALKKYDTVLQAGHASSHGDGNKYGVSTQIKTLVLDPSDAQNHVSAPAGSFDEKMIDHFFTNGAENYLPAIPLKLGSTTCLGDSGGPVFKEKNGEMLLYGVNGLVVGNDKLGSLKCSYAYVQFFTPIAPFLDWIESKIQEWK